MARLTAFVKRQAEYCSAGLIYLGAAVFFYHSELFGTVTFPVDLPDFDYPRFFFLATWIHRHVLPLWDPHVGFGIPLAGMMESQTFYPPLYIALFLGGATPGIRVVEWLTVSHLALAALGAYALCRALRLARPACFMAGVIFAFGGFFALRIFNCGWVETAAWFPFVLAAFVRFLETKNLRYVAWMSAVFLVMMLAGFWQQVMYSMYFTVFWACWETVCRLVRRERVRLALLPVIAVVVACGAALLCDTCELLPTYAFAKDTARQKLTLEESAGTGLRISDMPAILWAGKFIGKDGLTRWNARRVNSGIRDYYPGTITLVLLACNIWLLFRRPDRNQFFLWGSLLLFGAASFGTLTPIFGTFYHFAPGFSFFRRSGSLYFFPVLAAAVLSAYTLNHFATVRLDRSLRIAFRYVMLLGLIPAALAFLLRGSGDTRGALLYFAALEVSAVLLFTLAHMPARASLLLALFSGMCFADLYYFHGMQFAFVLRNFEYPHLSGIAAAANSPNDPFRVALAPFGGNWDNLGEIDGFENSGGYVIFRQKRYQDYFEHIQSLNSPLLALANARYLLTTPALMLAGLRKVSVGASENRLELPSGSPEPSVYKLEGDFAGGLKLFRNLSATPRYYFSSRVEVIPNEQEQLTRMSDPTLAAQHASIVEFNPQVPVADCSGDPVRVLSYTPNAIELSVVAHANCLLIATDSYSPGWKTYIDGTATSVYRANSIFRASPVPAGAHSVELSYEPVTLWIGMAISVVSILGMLAIYFLLRGPLESAFERSFSHS